MLFKMLEKVNEDRERRIKEKNLALMKKIKRLERRKQRLDRGMDPMDGNDEDEEIDEIEEFMEHEHQMQANKSNGQFAGY
jgi:hypothetical protein